ncbi:MAG TPA: efflux RND transporter periplasmic adaptor subunit [Gemmatimonadales bacterium]|nr:efflux RND transporter periplasmic adaptor subunit [Gemmatimonadales bacterium]
MRRGLLAGVLLLAACGHAGSEDEAGPADSTRVPVGLGSVVRDSIVEQATVTGRLEARPGGAALLAAPAAGVVRAVVAQVGDRVRPRQVLLELEVPELVADAEQRASAAAQAQREAERQQRLLADGITSARQAEEASAAARQAQTAAIAARNLLTRTRVSSPIAGRVQQIYVQRGERVDAGKPLAQVIAGDTLDLVGAAPVATLGRLRQGQNAMIAQEGDSTRYRGWVAALAPGVDSATGAGQVVLRVPNPDGALRAGAGAQGWIRLGVRHDALVVPDSAIVLQGDSSTVFVVGRDSVAHARTVVRGAHQEGRTEVRGNLAPGDRIVTTGAFGLQDGMRVAPFGVTDR